MSGTFTKRSFGRPAQWEVAGISWLTEQVAHGGAAVVEVISADDNGLTEKRVDSAPPTRSAALDFGRRLAVTHELSDVRWGGGPAGWDGPGYQGPNQHLLELPLRPHESWGSMYADERVAPLVARAGFRADERSAIERVCTRLRSGEFDTDDAPSRLHGDLWSGNVMWSPDGCVLIDPSAHVGHRETDLAALQLFGCTHLEGILAGYQEAHPLAHGWRERVELHQLSMVLMHVVVFGGGYVRTAAEMARRYA